MPILNFQTFVAWTFNARFEFLGPFLFWISIAIHFGKRSLTPPNFILEQQTESHMKAEVFS